MPGDRFGLAVHAAQHGEQFRQALIDFTKYASLPITLFECQLDERPPIARFVTRLRCNPFGLDRHVADVAFTALAKGARGHLAEPMVVREVRLVHALAFARGEYERMFSGLLEQTRRSLAPSLLAEPDSNVEQVGFRLGCSEPTAFIRAFKKWYGVTPGSYPRALNEIRCDFREAPLPRRRGARRVRVAGMKRPDVRAASRA